MVRRSAGHAGRLGSMLPPDVLERHPPRCWPTWAMWPGCTAASTRRWAGTNRPKPTAVGQGDLRSAGQALRGQARVYLDTVNPTQAEHLLQEALRLSDGQEDRETRIRLLELLAENRLNLGRLEDAERFQSQAAALRDEVSSEAELAVRAGAHGPAERSAFDPGGERAEAERRAPCVAPASTGKPCCCSRCCWPSKATAMPLRTAVDGTERGQALSSPFITAVGFMRQGHAW